MRSESSWKFLQAQFPYSQSNFILSNGIDLFHSKPFRAETDCADWTLQGILVVLYCQFLALLVERPGSIIMLLNVFSVRSWRGFEAIATQFAAIASQEFALATDSSGLFR
jgi:hypothetical protein